MSGIDKVLLRDILLKCRDYEGDENCATLFDINDINLKKHLDYLAGHKLLVIKTSKFMNGKCSLNSVIITPHGVDYLEEDGGFSASLRTVTVKFDEESIKSILSDGILKSSASNEDKVSFLEKLRTLPSTALEKLIEKLVEKSIESPDAILRAISSIL